MENINYLIDYIKNNYPENGHFKGSWEKFLTQGCPNWRSLVKNPNNWPLIEKVMPLEYFHTLCDALVNAAGAGLAVRWFNSKVKEHREAAREWLEDFARTPTPEIWSELSDEAKEYIVHRVFANYPGEPFGIYRDFARSIEHLAHESRRSSSIPGIQLTLPAIGYLPSSKISQLRSIIQRAGDRKFLRIVNDMIKERKKACEKSFSQSWSPRILYTPTRDERELIARVMDKLIANGYMPSVLPQIFLSLEAPPLFVAYPELEEKEIEERKLEQREPYIPRNKQRGIPKHISIEELLGCYIPNPQIILYQRGLKWCARRYNFDEDLLRAIVLIHEIGHWVTHLLPKPGIPFWPTELYKLTSMEVCEGWAQLITWWVVDEIGGEIKQVFEKLNGLQPHPYRVYDQFKSNSVNSVINSLELLRQLRWPAGIEDWKRFIK